MIKNDVRVLSANTVEQDIVEEAVGRDSSGKATKLFYEMVYRFTKNRALDMHVEVAAVKYGGNGKWWSKIVMSGDLK